MSWSDAAAVGAGHMAAGFAPWAGTAAAVVGTGTLAAGAAGPVVHRCCAHVDRDRRASSQRLENSIAACDTRSEGIADGPTALPP